MTSVDRRQDLREAIQFVIQNMRYWKLDEQVQGFYQNWLRKLDSTDEPCEHLRPPKINERPRSSEQQLRYRMFLDEELKQHVLEGRLSEQLLANLIEENLRIQSELQAEVNKSAKSSDAGHVSEAGPEAGESLLGDRQDSEKTNSNLGLSIAGKLLETILDPRSLQYLMMLGSALLVLGLVIWLATQGFFDDPLVIAISAAIVNLAVLGSGAYLLRFSRYETTGRGLMLLASLAMPLHLWFYDAQGLIVLDEGGHLWIPALVIAALYAGCAILIRDPLFAYAMVGGITLTGLMILGDQNIAKFWEGAAVSSLLVAIGAIAIHSEKVFVSGDAAFSRKHFGVALYRAGHCVLLGGLAVLFGWSISAWTYDGVMADLWRLGQQGPMPFDQPSLTTSTQLKTLAFSLSLIATYLYGYSYFLVTRRKTWIFGGVVTFLWAEMMFIDALSIPVTQEFIMMVFAVTAICFLWFGWGVRSLDETGGNEKESLTLIGSMQALAFAFLMPPLAMGIAGYLRFSFRHLEPFELTPLFTVALTTMALACCLGISLTRSRFVYLSVIYAICSCFAFLLASFGGLELMNLEPWDVAGPLLMLIPVGYLVISPRFSNGNRTSFEIASQCGASLLTLAVLVSAYGISLRRIEPLAGQASEIMLSLFLMEVSLFYGLYAIITKRYFVSYLALLAGCTAIVQIQHYWGTSYELTLFTFGSIGMLMILFDRLLELARKEVSAQYRTLRTGGQLLLSLAGAGSVLLALNRLMMIGFHGGTLALLLGMVAISLVAAVLVRTHEVSRWYVSLAVAQACSVLLLIAFGLALEPWQKLELLCATLGIVILIASHVGWVQERENKEDWVTLGLIIGSLLWAVPMAIGLLGQRFDYYTETSHWRIVHEVGALVAGLSLLGTGILFRLRSTTIVGTTAMLLYIGTLVVYVRLPDQLQGVAVYMMIGGGVFFVVSVLLSIFRDYLLAMPERFRHRRGLFRVLTWR